jgi:hypothetical protein
MKNEKIRPTSHAGLHPVQEDKEEGENKLEGENKQEGTRRKKDQKKYQDPLFLARTDDDGKCLWAIYFAAVVSGGDSRVSGGFRGIISCRSIVGLVGGLSHEQRRGASHRK